MSRLWSKLWPAPSGAIGLGFSGDRLLALRVERTGEGNRITHMAEETLPFMPFRGAVPRPEDCVNLSQAMQRLAAVVPQGYWPLRVALPDGAAILQVLEFESLPGSARERAAIGRFRMEKEWPAVAQMECAFQVLSDEAGHAMLLASAVSRAWLDCLREACRTAGWAPSAVDVGVNQVFNRFHDAIADTPGDGALISIERGTWSILLWDQAQRPRFLRNRWREASAGGDGDYDGIAQNVERLVRAYVLGSAGRGIQRIYLCADEADRAPFADMLNARMRTPCVHLDATERVTAPPDVLLGRISPSVLAAAMQSS